jgi:cell division protein FtsW (lipid II flippase)
MTQEQQTSRGGWFTSKANWALVGFLAIIGFLLLTEHRAHVLGALPIIILLLVCVVLHRFMHGGHREDHGGGDSNGDKP